jgi:hypothetical protein
MQTGENSQALRKIIDLSRFISIIILLLHFYSVNIDLFDRFNWTSEITNKFINNVQQTELFQSQIKVKLFALLFLFISLVGAKGKKDERVTYSRALCWVGVGMLLFFAHELFRLVGASPRQMLIVDVVSLFGFICILKGGTLLSRVLQLQLRKDIFNIDNESFPQEERLIENEYSINLPAHYALKGGRRKSWINIINPFRALLVIGTPGAGKSYFVIRHVITQHIKKGFSMFLYDFKYDDLSKIAYNTLLKNQNAYKIKPKFYVINFETVIHRCNPLEPSTMIDITDATESSRTIMLGLNRDWIKKQGDFFVESPINFVTAIIWFLRKYQNGKYCTLPHVIELMQVEYDKLFTVLRTEPEIEVLINPFISAYVHDAMEQLEGQIASAKIGMARLSSPQLYYVLSGNDFTLDINNPDDPKIVCVGNNPQKQQIFGAVLSLYISRVIKLVNRKRQQKCSLIFDEFPTIYFNGIDGLIATARANKVATTLGVQDYSQLKKDYGRDQAEVIMNIVGNVISGQVVGDTAKLLSERFGKIVQERESVSVNSSDTSVSKSTQLDYAIPASKIAGLSSGEFVGMVSDDPEQKIKLKAFHCHINNDHAALAAEEKSYKDIPVVRPISNNAITQNYLRIKTEVREIIETEIERLNLHSTVNGIKKRD